MIEGINNQKQFTHFNTGAVRDIQEDKGRCDLAPLSVEGLILNHWKFFADDVIVDTNSNCFHIILYNISQYQWSGTLNDLLNAICYFVSTNTSWNNPNNIENKNIKWNTDTPICLALLDVSKHYKEGSQKYGERNWEKGIPLHSFIDSAVRHLLKYMAGFVDERHDRAFIWNLMGAIYTHKYGDNKELLDIPFYNDALHNKLKPKKAMEDNNNECKEENW